MTFVLIMALGLIVYQIFVLPSWNKWGSTNEEYQAQYEVDKYCPQSDFA